MQVTTQDKQSLGEFISRHPRLAILTGAGISQASGIPTYRNYKGKWLPADPIQHRSFIEQKLTRQRYWTRSWYGWPVIRDATPNAAHDALARLEQMGRVELLITQNVDGLHQRAGSNNVVDLHGRIDRVRCLCCQRLHDRNAIQEQLATDNDWQALPQAPLRPDGDREIPASMYLQLEPPSCTICAGDLIPDVVFFGGNIPAQRLQRCRQAITDSDALLVVGSSLMVYSGYRFCRLAHQLGKPLAIINPGVTRADELATQRYHSAAAPLLTATLSQL